MSDKEKRLPLVCVYTRSVSVCSFTLIKPSFALIEKKKQTNKQKTKQNKTKQNKTKKKTNKQTKNKTKQNKTKQTKQNKTKQNKTKQNKTKQNKTKQNKKKQNKTKKKVWKRLPVPLWLPVSPPFFSSVYLLRNTSCSDIQLSFSLTIISNILFTIFCVNVY